MMTVVGYARIPDRFSLKTLSQRFSFSSCTAKSWPRLLTRPELKACLDYLRDGDTLLVTKLDRLAR
jgi:DNA invertase Pin-like site-specific DNA recombinase